MADLWSKARRHRPREYQMLSELVDTFLTMCDAEIDAENVSQTGDYRGLDRAERKANKARQAHESSLSKFAERCF